MNDVILAVRDLVADNYVSIHDVYTYLTSKVFTLTSANAIATSIVVYRNGSLYASSNYTFNSSTGMLTVIGTLVAGDVLEIVYNAYQKYSDNEIRGYIRAALSYLATEKYEVFVAKTDNEIFPTPIQGEVYLIAIIADILMRGSVRDYKTPEINISFMEKETREEKITRVIRQFKKTFGTIRFIKTDRDVKIDKEDE